MERYSIQQIESKIACKHPRSIKRPKSFIWLGNKEAKSRRQYLVWWRRIKYNGSGWNKRKFHCLGIKKWMEWNRR